MKLRTSVQLSICLRAFAIVLCGTLVRFPAESSPQLPGDLSRRLRTLADEQKPVSEAELRNAIQRVEQLAESLQTRTYREELRDALRKLGYGEHDPLFRTSLNGFEEREIDLDDADEFKRGAFAFGLRSAGHVLSPDPFDGWIEVQKQIDAFEPTMAGARRIVARGSVLAADTAGSIPLDVFRKLSKRWRAAVSRATEAYEHALAIRAVEYNDGELIPAQQSFRYIFDGGRYAVICAMDACSSQSADHSVW